MGIMLLKATDHRRMPWKNGGGVTVEIAVHPQGASVDDFDWRISMATVANDGPFSLFSGIDRTLSVLEGDGIVLDMAGVETVLTRESLPHFFPSDVTVSARLIGSAITDLNVMTRRGRFTHQVRRLTVDKLFEIDVDSSPALIFCAEGKIDLTSAQNTTQLATHDCAVLSNCAASPLQIGGNGTAYLISIISI
ncbi:HutD family protein [Ochrobactrum sp. CM-21-5]|nr:HutD family protein [Ochrobactrum sp. CM-21-5]MBC2886140.1 HutD family protein [Ochrobactrum sp. CM-21-5]